MNKKLTIPIFLVLLFSCSKDVSINNLESKDGVAYDPSTGETFNGKAFLDFYDGSLRMKGEYVRGIKNGIWKYYVQGSSSRFYNLDFKDGNITSVEYKDNDKYIEYFLFFIFLFRKFFVDPFNSIEGFPNLKFKGFVIILKKRYKPKDSKSGNAPNANAYHRYFLYPNKPLPHNA